MRKSELYDRAADAFESGEIQWTQCAGAKLSDGRNVLVTHPDATHFCMGGAVLRELVDIVGWEVAADTMVDFWTYMNLATDMEMQFAKWNDQDSRTVGEVVDALRFAAKYAREDEELGQER